MTEQIWTGGCLCGAIRYRATALPIRGVSVIAPCAAGIPARRRSRSCTFPARSFTWAAANLRSISHPSSPSAASARTAGAPCPCTRKSIYYDQIFLNIPLNAENAKKFVTTLITNPGYPDPNGPNPNRTGGPISPLPQRPSQFDPDNRTPYTEQLTAGMQRQLGRTFSVSADIVRARGLGLLRSMDANYPNLDDPSRTRPDPRYQRITVVETEGNSWYSGIAGWH